MVKLAQEKVKVPSTIDLIKTTWRKTKLSSINHNYSFWRKKGWFNPLYNVGSINRRKERPVF
jgi:hypothetical protein